MHERMLELFGEIIGPGGRESFAGDLERFYSSDEEIAAELRGLEPYLEGLLVAAGAIGPAALLVMTDCSMRVHNALHPE